MASREAEQAHSLPKPDQPFALEDGGLIAAAKIAGAG